MHESTSSHKQGRLLKGLLIDPYKHCVSLVDVRNDLRTWHRLLRCDCVDVNRVLAPIGNRECVDLWFDDEFLLKEPVGPGFAFLDSDGHARIYHGYGLMLSSNTDGESTDLHLFAHMPEDADAVDVALVMTIFQEAIDLKWEPWEKRVPASTFIDEQMRIPELELETDDFRCLAVLD